MPAQAKNRQFAKTQANGPLSLPKRPAPKHRLPRNVRTPKPFRPDTTPRQSSRAPKHRPPRNTRAPKPLAPETLAHLNSARLRPHPQPLVSQAEMQSEPRPKSHLTHTAAESPLTPLIYASQRASHLCLSSMHPSRSSHLCLSSIPHAHDTRARSANPRDRMQKQTSHVHASDRSRSYVCVAGRYAWPDAIRDQVLCVTRCAFAFSDRRSGPKIDFPTV